jgi:hypothetical protein
MDSVRDAWTDERLDDLNHRVDAGFSEVREEIRAMRAEINIRIDGIDARLDGIQRLMAQLAVALTAAMLAGFAGICALIATQT